MAAPDDGVRVTTRRNLLLLPPLLALALGLLVLLGCDAFGLSRIDDRRAAERHELLHPFEESRGIVFGPRATVTGPVSVGMIGE